MKCGMWDEFAGGNGKMIISRVAGPSGPEARMAGISPKWISKKSTGFESKAHGRKMAVERKTSGYPVFVHDNKRDTIGNRKILVLISDFPHI